VPAREAARAASAGVAVAARRVQVAIRYTGGGFGDSLGLHVYGAEGGPLVASSTGQIGTAQSVLLPKADRDYDVYVAFNPLIPEIAQPSAWPTPRCTGGG
jgi:hypothetical protein